MPAKGFIPKILKFHELLVIVYYSIMELDNGPIELNNNFGRLQVEQTNVPMVYLSLGKAHVPEHALFRSVNNDFGCYLISVAIIKPKTPVACRTSKLIRRT